MRILLYLLTLKRETVKTGDFMSLPAVVQDALNDNELLLITGGSGTNPDAANNGPGVCDGNNNKGGKCTGSNNAGGRCDGANNSGGTCGSSGGGGSHGGDGGDGSL